MTTQKFDIKMSRASSERTVGHAEDILVGRFPEGSVAEMGGRALSMGYLDEDIAEDADLAAGEKGTSEYYARRRKRRYKNKTALALEEQGSRAKAMGSIKLHGSLLDTKAEGGASAKYALFETVNRGGRMEVNMIPVDQWYSFKKPSRAAAITLDDLEIAFEQKERKKAESNKKFSRVLQAMELKSREHESKTGGGDAGADGGTDIAFGAPLFGPEATKALARSGQRSGENKKFKGYMDDAGGTLAKEEDNDMECGGNDADVDDTFRDRGEDIDFDNTFSDDDNDADALQKADEDREETLAREIDGAGGEDSDDEGYDDSGADSDTGGKDDLGGSGLYETDALVRSAMEYNFLLKQREQKRQNVEGANEADSSDQPAAKKQKLSPGSKSLETSSSVKGSAVSASAASSSSAGAHGKQVFEFSEDGIRQFIRCCDGRTTVKKLLEQYKKQMKAIGPSAAGKLKEMLLKVTTTVEDAVQGKILILK